MNSAVFPIARIMGPGIKCGNGSGSFRPMDTFVKCLLVIHTAPGTTTSDTIFPKGEMFPTGARVVVPSDWKLRLPPGHEGLFMPRGPEAKKGFVSWLR